MKRGSFGGHFEELVKHFHHDTKDRDRSQSKKRSLQEKRDIHALLFERAWQIDRLDDASS